MTAIHRRKGEFVLSCDTVWCSPPVEFRVPEDTKTGRKLAQDQAGWDTAVHKGRVLDICPSCKKRIETINAAKNT